MVARVGAESGIQPATGVRWPVRPDGAGADGGVRPRRYEHLHVGRVLSDRPYVVVPTKAETQGENDRNPQFDDLVVDGVPGLEGRIETNAVDESQDVVMADEESLLLELRDIPLEGVDEDRQRSVRRQVDRYVLRDLVHIRSADGLQA